MKSPLALALVVSSIPALSFADGPTVSPVAALRTSVSFNAASQAPINVSFGTTTSFSSMCTLGVQAMKLIPTRSIFNAARDSWDTLPGSIDLTVAVQANSMCFMAFGPHSGSVSFAMGSGLPTLAQGPYAIVINGEAQGTLVVGADSASLQ